MKRQVGMLRMASSWASLLSRDLRHSAPKTQLWPVFVIRGLFNWISLHPVTLSKTWRCELTGDRINLNKEENHSSSNNDSWGKCSNYFSFPSSLAFFILDERGEKAIEANKIMLACRLKKPLYLSPRLLHNSKRRRACAEKNHKGNNTQCAFSGMWTTNKEERTIFFHSVTSSFNISLRWARSTTE